MNNEEWISSELEKISKKNLTRKTTAHDLVSRLNLSSNDYLNLAENPEVIRKARTYLEEFGCGSRSSRLVTGTMLCHLKLEQELAEFKNYPSSLVFGSGYLANAGTIPVLVGRHDVVFADKLVHASIIDAIQLSGAEMKRFRHNDMDNLSDMMKNHSGPGKKLIVTESVFSMDGDLAPLNDMAELAGKHNAMLMIDEAHATGIFGPSGSGRIAELDLTEQVNVSMGTLSKALGCYGGFTACSSEMRGLLVNNARAFIYTTAPPPALVGSALGALDQLKKNPDLGKELLKNADIFRTLLNDAGLDTGPSESQIIPLMVGDSASALELSRELQNRGILAVAIRPPTVPEGTARIRFSVTLAHSRTQLEEAAATIIECAGKTI